jgi:hypothetical protein
MLHSDLPKVFSRKIMSSQVIISIGPPAAEDYQAEVNQGGCVALVQDRVAGGTNVPARKLPLF